MAYKYNDIKRMTRDVDTVSRRVMMRAFNDAMADFEGQLFLDFQELGEDEKMFEYRPKDRKYIFGANNVQPASCSSLPGDVEMSNGDSIKGLTHLFESGYHLCIHECEANSLEEEIYNKEYAVAMSLIHMLFQQMWYGIPELMQFGLLNHPLIEVIQSPPTNTPGEETCGGSDNCGSTKWEHKSINEIVREIKSAIRHYTNPQLLVSQNSYEESMFVLDDRLLAAGTPGVYRFEQVQDALSKGRIGVGLGEIIPTEELDMHPEYGNKDIAIAMDRGAMALTASQPIWKGASHDQKNVHVVREIRTGGLRINYADAIKVMVGV